MTRSSDLLEVAARLNEASWQDDGAELIIQCLSDHLGCEGGVLLSFQGDDITTIHNYGLAPVEAEFADEIVSDPALSQPHVAYHLKLNRPDTVTDYDFFDESELDRHPFYDWLQRACGVRYFIGSRLERLGPEIQLLGMHYTQQQGHASEQQSRDCELLRPHAANAFRVAALRRHAENAMTFSQLIGSTNSEGFAGLNQHGSCVISNKTADDIFLEQDGISLDADGHLSFASRKCGGAFGRLVAQGLTAASGQSLFAGGTLAIERPSGRLPYILRVSAGLKRTIGYDVGLPTLVVTIIDPESRLSVRRTELELVFGLTNREIELINWLVQGKDLKEVAQAMGVAHNTARVHLQNAMSKTKSHSQSELVGKALAVAGP